MNIQQFQYVLAVAENRHFEQAAEKCYITQSTLSTMISKLEEEIGVRIFDRKKKPVQITNEGLIIIEQIKRINNSISQLGELVKEIKGEVKGNLSIAAIPTIAPYLLPLFLQDFAGQFSDLHIQVKEQTTSEIVRQVKLRELDLGIVSIPLKDPDLVEVKLYDEPFVLYDAGQTHANDISIKKMDVSNLWLMEEGHCLRTQVEKLCKLSNRQIKPKVNFDFKAGSIDSLVRFVKAGKSATLLPYLSVNNLPREELKYIRQFSAPVPMRSVGIIVHKHFVKKHVLDLIQQEILKKVNPLLPKMKIKTELLAPV
ncbi:MAG: LysR substrate-binding domain-containing protein [Bacteroidetes bacterium]|nr:LysR substrate-binding domain-containing protein [Bacteroidota bacterium]